MPRISAVIIAFNEERNIGRCIESLDRVADEIIVIDSFSTDNTPAICKGRGVRFIQHPWQGYASQKNFGTEQAEFEFILSIDADEALSDELRKSVLKAKEQATCDAYSMNRLTNYCGKWIRHGGWYPDPKIRLFRKGIATWKETKVHETLEVTKNARLCHLSGDLLHYSYYTITDHIFQIERYSRLAAEQLFEQKKPFHWWQLLVKPCARFLKSYLLRGGFRDGFYGYVIARNSAWSSFIRYARLHELYKNQQISG